MIQETYVETWGIIETINQIDAILVKNIIAI